jgi:hypothetical protein
MFIPEFNVDPHFWGARGSPNFFGDRAHGVPVDGVDQTHPSVPFRVAVV